MKVVFSLIVITIILITVPVLAGSFQNIMFLHHSTGANLISQGNVRGLIASYNSQHGTNLEFWDHGYNGDGIRDQNETYYSGYDIPGDNTNPDGFYTLFNQPVHMPPDNAFSKFMVAHSMGARTIDHQVFIFKSCFPASDITSDGMLQQYKDWYLSIRFIMDAHPEKIFIPLTPPPLVRSATTPENAERARLFAEWLSSPGYLLGHPNVFVYDFWGDLAEHDSTSIYYNCLKEAYGGDGGDSHPNQLANETVAPLFVNHIISAINTYQLVGDAGIPDSVIIGHLDGSPISVRPGDTVNVPIWVKNDEFVGGLMLPVATDSNLVTERIGGRSSLPLVFWDYVQLGGLDRNQPLAGFITQTLIAVARETTAVPMYLNTNGIYNKIYDFTMVISPDTLNVGQTTNVIEGFHPPMGWMAFADILGDSLWRPACLGGRLTIGQPLGVIAGTITNQGGNPIGGAVVQILGTAIIDTADIDGHYRLARIPDGNYDIQFKLHGLIDTTITDVAALIGTTATLDLVISGSCVYILGDINGNYLVRGSDVTYAVGYFKGLRSNLPDSCFNDSIGTSNHYLYVAGDVNASCDFRGSDITRLVLYFRGSATLESCRFFPSHGLYLKR